MTDIDLDAVVDAIRALGADAYVEHTGGGCATICVGQPDADGEYPMMAGPGWFTGPAWTRGMARPGDFYIGQGGDDDPVEVVHIVDPAGIAARIVGHLHEAAAR